MANGTQFERWGSLPEGIWQHLIERMRDRAISVSDTSIASPPLVATPGRATFRFVQGSPVPAAQEIAVTGTGTFSIASSSGWLKPSVTTTNAPSTLWISIDPSGLAPGSHAGTVTITPQSGAPTAIDVALTVLAPAPVLTEILPALLSPGSDHTTVVLRGSGFTQETIVQIFEVQWRDTLVTFR